MPRAEKTKTSKYTNNRSPPTSPNQKSRSLGRKGSHEKGVSIRGGRGGSTTGRGKGGSGGTGGGRRKLRRSATEPAAQSAAALSRSSGLAARRPAHERGRSRSGSPKGSKGGSSARSIVKEKALKSSGIDRGGGGSGGGGSASVSGSGVDRDPGVKKPNGQAKCLRKLCGGAAIGDYEASSPEARRTVSKLKLKATDLRRLRVSFNDIDIDESGEIDYDEFLEHMEEQRNIFTDAVFRLIDENGDGVLEFDEFIGICGSFCMWSQGEILKFCFDTFDADGGGTIDEEEFEVLAKTIAGKDPMFPGNFSRALEEFDTDGDGLIDFGEFCTMNRRYPMALFPMFRLQDKMQRCTLGASRWNVIMKQSHTLEKLRQYRITHSRDLPPEGCCAKIWRCGAPRLGADEDFADLEMAARKEKATGNTRANGKGNSSKSTWT